MFAVPAPAPAPAAAPPAIGGYGLDANGQATNPMLQFAQPDDFDALLPAPAAEKFRTLREIREDDKAIAWAIIGDNVESVQERIAASARISQLLAGGDHRQPVGEGHPELVKARAKLARIDDDRARREQRAAPHRDRMAALDRVLGPVTRYVRDHARILRPAPAVKLTAKDDLPGAIEAVAHLHADRREILAAPCTAADTKKRAIAEIEFVASHGQVSAARSVESGAPLKWPTSDRHRIQPLTVRGFGRQVPGLDESFFQSEIDAGMAVAVWANRDQIIERVCAEIAEHEDPEYALSDEDRAAKLAALAEQMLEAERKVAALIWRDGEHMAWPSEIDVRAIISVVGPEPRQD